MATPRLKSAATRSFWAQFHALSEDIQKLAIKNYHLWRQDPHHASLRFRRLKGGKDRFSIRVGDHYRALGRLADGTITWVWIGTHAEYDRIVSSES